MVTQMVSVPRGDVIVSGEVGIYHVWTRTVRQGWICGLDPITGKDYSHRRQWIREFLEELAKHFGVEIGFHAEMSNHLHLVLRARPDVVQAWSDEEVVRRSMTIERLAKSKTGKLVQELPKGEITMQANDRARVAELRERLSHVSHFMKTLCEYIGRRANREDHCKGRFFEERFSCRRLLDEAATLVCGIYVDLNQIRAGEAFSPEESQHTSAYDRIQDLENASLAGAKQASNGSGVQAGWMCELTLQQGSTVDLAELNRTQSDRRASEKGLLPISLTDYLSLLDWTGRQRRDDKAGAIPETYGAILDRLQINRSMWTELTSRFDQLFGCMVGNATAVARRALARGRQRYQSQSYCSAAFG